MNFSLPNVMSIPFIPTNAQRIRYDRIRSLDWDEVDRAFTGETTTINEEEELAIYIAFPGGRIQERTIFAQKVTRRILTIFSAFGENLRELNPEISQNRDIGSEFNEFLNIICQMATQTYQCVNGVHPVIMSIFLFDDESLKNMTEKEVKRKLWDLSYKEYIQHDEDRLMFTYENTDILFDRFTALDTNMEIFQSIFHSQTTLMLTKEWAIDNCDNEPESRSDADSDDDMEDLFWRRFYYIP